MASLFGIPDLKMALYFPFVPVIPGGYPEMIKKKREEKKKKKKLDEVVCYFL